MTDATNAQQNQWDWTINNQNTSQWNINSDNTQPQGSIIGKINDENQTELDYQNGDLRKMWNTLNISQQKKSSNTTYIALLIFMIILTSIVWVLFFKYDKYIIDYSNWIEDTNRNIADLYEKTKEKVFRLIWKEYEKPNITISLETTIWESNLNGLIQGKKSYIEKKEILKNSMVNLSNEIINNSNELNDAQKQLSTYGFFSSKLSNIISNDESISSVQDSLTAIEAIKFNSAIAVFSKLDTFLESLSKETGMDKEEIEEAINNISKRWEKDINLYLKNCHLNAYEIDYNCNNIWDFDKYYELTEDKEFNTKFFKELIQFADEKLEQTEIPSFSIKFRSFNQQSNELTFDIEINTFKEDERELAKKWILSSHSFILNNLINNLKLSRAIISEWIEVKSINVKQRTIPIWMTEFTVNTSNKTFSVPIKNENQIEIDDFLY